MDDTLGSYVATSILEKLIIDKNEESPAFRYKTEREITASYSPPDHCKSNHRGDLRKMIPCKNGDYCAYKHYGKCAYKH